MKPTSNCAKYVKFSLKSVENSKARIRPVQCSICKEVYWSYHLQKHFYLRHPAEEWPIVVNENEWIAVLKSR